MEPGSLGNVSECSITIVVEKNVVTPVGQKQVVPAIVVIIANTGAHAPAGPAQTRLLCNVDKSPVPIVLEEVAGGFLSRRPGGVKPGPVGKIDIQPPVLVIIKKCDSTSFGLHNVFLALHAAPDVSDVQPGLRGHIDVGHR